MAATRPTHNFAAGPSALPEAALRQAQAEMLDYAGSGISVMELSHRSPQFERILADTTAAVRALLKVPPNYKILYMQGGGTLQFACVPLNLLGELNAPADYIVTGAWSDKAAAEARKYSDRIHIAAHGKTAHGYTTVPRQSEWQLTPGAKYVYYCANETIDGVEFDFVPDTQGVPLVVDMSSNIFSRPVDVSRFGLIFAGAQKNMGPAGVTLVIVREDLLGTAASRTIRPGWQRVGGTDGGVGKALPITPIMCDYKVMADHTSLYNTPPTYAIYMTGLVLQWIQAQGGVEEMDRRSQAKADRLYAAIEGSNGFFWCPVAPGVRSRMNVPFRIRRDGRADERAETERPGHSGWADEIKEAENTCRHQFLAGAEAQGMIQLKGHRSLGGIRASLYNAVELTAVDTLVSYMRQFHQQRSGATAPAV